MRLTCRRIESSLAHRSGPLRRLLLSGDADRGMKQQEWETKRQKFFTSVFPVSPILRADCCDRASLNFSWAGADGFRDLLIEVSNGSHKDVNPENRVDDFLTAVPNCQCDIGQLTETTVT